MPNILRSEFKLSDIQYENYAVLLTVSIGGYGRRLPADIDEISSSGSYFAGLFLSG